MLIPDFVKKDPYLMPHNATIVGRMRKAYNKEKELTGQAAALSDFALGHMYYGLHKEDDGWVYRDWAPNATKIYFLSEFTGWRPDERYVLHALGGGNWELRLPGEMLRHGDLYKLFICWNGGSGERIPAWSKRVIQDRGNMVFNAQVWDPPEPHFWKHDPPSGDRFSPYVYEAHTGMATEEYEVGSWNSFREHVLPAIEKAGYNTIQLMAVQEHPYYGSFGYHVSSFFAASSRFGTPEDLKALIDDAHGIGVLGEKGEGLVGHRFTAQQVPLVTGTLGKALGSSGAFIAGDQVVIDTLRQFARQYIYTTAQPAAQACATLKALDILEQDPERRWTLLQRVKSFRQQALAAGLPLMDSATPIQPLMLGSNQQALDWSQTLKDRGFLVTAIRPPTVPAGTARLRVTLSAKHSEEQIRQLVAVLAELKAQHSGESDA